MNTIGLRREEKPFETRVPLVPDHLGELSEKHQIRFVVEPSDQVQQALSFRRVSLLCADRWCSCDLSRLVCESMLRGTPCGIVRTL